MHRRLRLFSWVQPRPKEPEGDSLQVAFRVEDDDAGSALLARLGLARRSQLQRPHDGPFRGATVLASASSIHMHQSQAAWHRHPLAIVRLWNDATPYEITPLVVAEAEVIEQRLITYGADNLPREHRLLSWITRDLHPEYFSND